MAASPDEPPLAPECRTGDFATLQLGFPDSGVLAASGCSVFAVAADGPPGPIVDAPPVLIFSQPTAGGPPTPLVRTVGRVSNVSVFNGRLHWYRTSGLQDARRFLEWRSLTDDAFGSVELTDRARSFDYMTSGPEGIYVGIRVYGDDSAGGIYVFTRDGQSRRIVALPAAGPLAADPDALYYLTERFQGSLVRRSLADGSEITLGTGMSWNVTLDRERVYTQGPNDTIVAFDKASGKQVVSVPATVSYLANVSTLGGDLVWLEQDGTLVRERVDGTCKHRVVADALALGFFADGDALYVPSRTPGVVVLYR